MTRPTDCTMSTTDLRGVRNITASSAGTSTPSDRQRALVRMRQVFVRVGRRPSASRAAFLALQHVDRCRRRASASHVERLGSRSSADVAVRRRGAPMSWATTAKSRRTASSCLDRRGRRRPPGASAPSSPATDSGRRSLGQAVPAADDLGGVVQRELAVVVGELLLEGAGDRRPRPRPGRAPCSRSAGLARRPRRSRAGGTPGRRARSSSIEHSTASASVGLGLDVVAVDARRGGHVEPLVPPDDSRRRGPARSADSSSPARVTPVVRCASSQMIRSNSGKPCLAAPRRRRRSTGRWRRRPSCRSASALRGCAAERRAASVVAGRARSWTSVSASRRSSRACPTLVSEHTANGRSGTRRSPSTPRASGTAATMRRHQEQHRARPCRPASSAILQRGERLAGAAGHDQLAAVAPEARRTRRPWPRPGAGASSLRRHDMDLAVALRTATQSTPLCSRSSRPIRSSRTFWSFSASSACSPHSAAVGDDHAAGERCACPSGEEAVDVGFLERCRRGRTCTGWRTSRRLALATRSMPCRCRRARLSAKAFQVSTRAYSSAMPGSS